MTTKHPLISLFMFGCVIQTLQGNAASGMSVPPKNFDLGTSLHGCDEDVERKKVNCFDRGFDSVPQNLPEDTEILSLGRNNITSLLNSSFNRYPLLTELIFVFNNIRVIESAAFYPLKNLIRIEISISDKSHLVLPATGLFRWARKLSYVDMSGSNLMLIPNDTLKWSPKLDIVDLHYNLLTRINISSCGIARHVYLSNNFIEKLTVEAFNFVCQTDILDLSGNPIKSVDPDVITSLHVRALALGGHTLAVDELRNIFMGISRSQIKYFTFFHGANLSVVPKNLFDPLRDYALTVLTLSENQLHDLYPFVFSNLTRIKKFTLHRNGLVTIEPNFFEGMRELRILKLGFNKIEYINTYNLSWTVNLTELHLSHNSLKTIRDFAFRGLHSLTLLDLSSNELLLTVEWNTFRNLESIQTIDLSNCNIQQIPLMNPSLTSLFLNDNNLFHARLATSIHPSIKFVKYLEIRHSMLHINDLWSPELNVSFFDGMFNLTTLDLSKNCLSSGGVQDDLPPRVLQQLSALQNLTLEGCYTSNLHPQAFTGLKSLQVLILRNNKIEHLHVDLFKELSQVTSIDLVDNLLADLGTEIFSNNPMLKTLLLSNNRLTRLEHNTFKPIYSSLSSIDLSMNSITCNCDLRWLLDWLNHGPLNLTDEKATKCSLASLEPLRERPLLEFDPKELCTVNIVVPCLSFFAVVCLIIVAVLVYHYRWQLRYKLFLVKLAALGYNDMRDARDHNDYEFDVNIIFFDDDEGWIREHLRPALHEHLPQFQRNVFGDADLVWGMHYLDSVDYVVTHSYKTIMVLSRAAVRDRWFMLKFRTAMDHVSDTMTEFVVVVFLEDIPGDEIPFLARLYLNDGRPYLYWTENVRGQRYFWEELAKNLTINLKTNDLIPNE